MKVYLASRSPRRQQLLRQIGVNFETVDIEIDEHWHNHEVPHQYVQRMALEKARAAKQKLPDKSGIIIAADTSVVLDDQVLGKALSKSDVTLMLQKLSGRKHTVYTAVAIVSENSENVSLNTSYVSFKVLSGQDIGDYADSEEPLGKAGGYAIQGKAAVFIEKLEGSYSGVMGLPLYETKEMLK